MGATPPPPKRTTEETEELKLLDDFYDFARAGRQPRLKSRLSTPTTLSFIGLFSIKLWAKLILRGLKHAGAHGYERIRDAG